MYKGPKKKNPNLITDAEYKSLVDSHVMFKDMDADPYLKSAGISADWPYGRGCYVSDDGQVIIWMGEEDQLRIISMQNGGDIGAVFTRLMAGISALEKKLDTLFDPQRGFISTCPSNLGTGMRASVHINLPHASKDFRFKQICDELHLQPRGADGEHSSTEGKSLFDISPLKRLGLTEVDCAKALHQGATRLIALERELAAL